MYNKKGDYGFPIYFVPALIIFIIILSLFSFLFFAADIINSPNLIIKTESYQDSSKLMVLLKSVVQIKNENITIAELISLSYENKEYKEILNTEIKKLISKLPKPPRAEDLAEVNILTPSATQSGLQKAEWNLDLEFEDEIIHIGEKSSFGRSYFSQTAIMPISNNNLAKINLYLDCFSCSKEGIEAIA